MKNTLKPLKFNTVEELISGLDTMKSEGFQALFQPFTHRNEICLIALKQEEEPEDVARRQAMESALRKDCQAAPAVTAPTKPSKTSKAKSASK